jgi:hypothetical protein
MSSPKEGFKGETKGILKKVIHLELSLMVSQ